MAEEYRPVAPVDPTNLRPMLFLDVAHEMMLDQDWPYRAVSAVMESHTGPGRFAFYGANHPDSIEDVHARRVDISILNPAALLTMAHRGTGALDSPREVATIAVLPHDDQLGFAVTDRLRFTSLEDIAAARYPLRVSVRGSIDACTPIMVDVVLRAHGLCLDDIRATVDFSGWPIYCRSDTPDALVEKFCQALVSRREDIVWDIGGVHQPPLPLERMVRESPATPLDVPMHPRAAVWRQHGYLP